MYKGLFSFGWCDEEMWDYKTENVLVKPADECYKCANKTCEKIQIIN